MIGQCGYIPELQPGDLWCACPRKCVVQRYMERPWRCQYAVYSELEVVRIMKEMASERAKA